jgi:hypothetical protein
MQVIAADAPSRRADRYQVAVSAVSAALLLLVGAMLAWLCLGTPVLANLTPLGRPDAIEMASGVLVWILAIAIPAAFLILGIARLVAVLEAIGAMRANTVTRTLAAALGPDHLAAMNLMLPGGRRIHELVLGPFGIVVIGTVPPPSVSRNVGSRWELLDGRGRWIPIEGPLQRTARDAERVRSWLTADDRDFPVRVYAAVLSVGRGLERTPDCAVVAPADLAEWLVALPFQRGLTSSRREHLVELIRSVAVPD